MGYTLDGEITDLMPFGLLNKYEKYEDFKAEYFRRLDRIGTTQIRIALQRYERMGKDVALLCYEDVRVPGDWCHRTAFAEWWLRKTGEVIEELYDPTEPKKAVAPKKEKKSGTESSNEEEKAVQIKMF